MMKIEMKVTERDKKLLLILGIVLVAAAFWLCGIRPVKSSIEEFESRRDELSLKRDTMEIAITALKGQEAVLEQEESAAAEQKKNFLPMMTSEEIDKMITDLCLKYNLTVKKLTIGEPEQAKILPYEEGEEETEAVAENTAVYTVEISSCTVTGTDTDIRSLIDELEQTAGIRLAGCAFSVDRESAAAGTGAAASVTVTSVPKAELALSLYLCE